MRRERRSRSATDVDSGVDGVGARRERAIAAIAAPQRGVVTRERGIRVHCVAALNRRDVRKLDGIPVTAAPRTILDLAAVASSRELEQALAEAETRRLVRRSELPPPRSVSSP